MAKNNRTAAEIKEDGKRYVPIQSPVVIKLYKEIMNYQKEANPHLEKMEKISRELDPFFKKLRDLEEEKQKIQAEMKPIKEPYDIELKKVELIEQRANLIKNKIRPIVDDEIKAQLGDFEEPTNVVERNGTLYVEIIDKLEQYKRTYLERKQKSPAK